MSARYLIERDEAEAKRLELQHTVWIRALGYHLHPKVEATLPKSARIADVGTGTAIWAIDVAKSHPEWQVDGFDISDAAFPPADKLPKNLKLTLHNLTTPFPEEFRGQFDAVHLRLLLLALGADDWARGLANVKSLLKPGGWVQWEEVNPDPWRTGLRTGEASASQSAAFPDNISKALEYAKNIALTSSNGVMDAHANLHNLFLADQDLKEVTKDVVASDRVPGMREDASRASVGVAFSMGKRMLAVGAPGAWSLEELTKVMEGVEKEITEGGYCLFYHQASLGRI